MPKSREYSIDVIQAPFPHIAKLNDDPSLHDDIEKGLANIAHKQLENTCNIQATGGFKLEHVVSLGTDPSRPESKTPYLLLVFAKESD